MISSNYLLAIESSCDETSAAVLKGREVLSNIIATQKVHEKYGGVVPELASRAHQSNIVPVVQQALKEAGISLKDLGAIAFTQGPGLMGALLVGTSFAKSLSLALKIPLIAVHHMEAHVLAHLIKNKEEHYPEFPFLCLTVSGGHTQIVQANSPLELFILGETIDDAAGEAFDKAAKVLGLPYPGGPQIDALAQSGNDLAYQFTKPRLDGYDFSFSGLKTSLLYFLRDQVKENPLFIERQKGNICASYQKTLVDYLLKNFEKAAKEKGIARLSLAGGVSANSRLRNQFKDLCESNNWECFIPPFSYCTDNAAMIGIAGWYKWQEGIFENLAVAPQARMKLKKK